MKKILVLALAITLILGGAALAVEDPSFARIDWGYTIRIATFEEISDEGATFTIYRDAKSGGSFCHTFATVGAKVNLDNLKPEREYCIFYTTKDNVPEELAFYTHYYSWGVIYADYERKAEFLNLVDVLRGYPDGSYGLENNLTRAEFAALLMRAIQADDTNKPDQALPFADAKGHWAEADISTAYHLGIIQGVSETEFAPEAFVTHEQMITMVVRAVGLMDYAQAAGGYPDGYWTTAEKAGIIEVYLKGGTTLANRRDVVEVLFAIMEYIPQEMPKPDHSHPPIDKPVIYLYPEQAQQVTVELDIVGEFIFTYPTYDNGWSVLAQPDGTLTTADGREYSYLFWEGIFAQFKPRFSEGFVVKGEDSVAFLQEKLEALGLTPREYNEFIVFWAPRMEANAYNKVYFAGEEYEASAPLSITPEPDSMLRVFMVFAPAAEGENLPPQQLSSFERKGFTVVEWGGMELS